MPVLPDEARKGAQRLVHFPCAREHCRYIWIEHHDVAARSIAARVLVRSCATKVVLR